MRIGKSKVKEIISKELENLIEASMTKGFSSAIEAYQKVQLQQQKLRKAFVAEKNVKKREQLKTALIKLHTIVQKAELEFNRALMQEPVELDENVKFYYDKKKDKILKFDSRKSNKFNK
tara:strand:- start:3695 stop:4051 length:357 start_codon:yes stop_codon:yes gene_type:complete